MWETVEVRLEERKASSLSSDQRKLANKEEILLDITNSKS